MARALFIFFSSLFLCLSASGQQVESLQLDTIGKKYILDITIEGNDKTKDRVILREVSLQLGDSLYWSNILAGVEQTRNNVQNLNLFNFVEVTPLQIGNDQVIVLISVQERWYIYPIPILELAQTNFNTWWETKELRWLNYGLVLEHKNFRGLNQRVSLTARFGYTKKFSASWAIPNLNKKQTLSLYLAGGYYENDEIVYNTLDNKREFYRVFDEGKAREYSKFEVGLGYREDIFLRHYVQLGYFNAHVQDTVVTLQPDYFTGNVSRSQFLRASYLISYDTRDYKEYALNGLLLSATLQQDGLGMVNKEGLNLFTTYLTFRHHLKLSDRFYFGYAGTGKTNWSTPPYYLTQALGYSKNLRGYEYYVIDGTGYGLFQSNLKFALVKRKNFKLPAIKAQEFGRAHIAIYANWFVDGGFVWGEDFEQRNSLVNEYLYSTGLGLDFVTYYDRVFRVEGAINALGETGLFIHFKQAF